MTISPITDSYDMYYGPARTGRSFENADSASPFFGEEHGSLKAGGPSQAEEKNLTGKGAGGRKKGIEDPSEECQTCKNRKYKDGSDEMVSFKSPQHVSNAYKKAAADDGKVVSASVSIHTAVCPECGRTYVSGGTTHTQIKYYNEENPYQQDLKSADRTKYVGMNLDYAI